MSSEGSINRNLYNTQNLIPSNIQDVNVNSFSKTKSESGVLKPIEQKVNDAVPNLVHENSESSLSHRDIQLKNTQTPTHSSAEPIEMSETPTETAGPSISHDTLNINSSDQKTKHIANTVLQNKEQDSSVAHEISPLISHQLHPSQIINHSKAEIAKPKQVDILTSHSQEKLTLKEVGKNEKTQEAKAIDLNDSIHNQNQANKFGNELDKLITVIKKMKREKNIDCKLQYKNNKLTVVVTDNKRGLLSIFSKPGTSTESREAMQYILNELDEFYSNKILSFQLEVDKGDNTVGHENQSFEFELDRLAGLSHVNVLLANNPDINTQLQHVREKGILASFQTQLNGHEQFNEGVQRNIEKIETVLTLIPQNTNGLDVTALVKLSDELNYNFNKCKSICEEIKSDPHLTEQKQNEFNRHSGELVRIKGQIATLLNELQGEILKSGFDQSGHLKKEFNSQETNSIIEYTNFYRKSMSINEQTIDWNNTSNYLDGLIELGQFFIYNK